MIKKWLQENKAWVKYAMIIKLVKYMLLLVYVFTSTACNKTSEAQKKHVFRYNEHTNISSLDPAFAKNQANIWAVNQLYTGLVQLDDSLNVKPDIATHWEVSSDGRTYTFYLRDDVYFHQHKAFGKLKTRKVYASDFLYSLNRLTDENVASPGSWVMQNVGEIKVIAPYVLSISLKTPFPGFLGLLSMKYCSVVPKEVIEIEGTNFRANPIGTGPFQFKLWVENTKLVLRKNTNYYEKDSKGNQLPYLEAVAITFLPDKQAEFMQFVQGNIDFLSGIDVSYKDELIDNSGKLNARFNDEINLYKSSYLNTEYLGFYLPASMDQKPVHELLRKAINYSFDREKMLFYLRNSIGKPAFHGIVPDGLSKPKKVRGYFYDMLKAKELVKQYKQQTNDLNPTVVVSTNSQYVDLCEYIQREVKKVGIEMKIDVVPSSMLRQAKASGKLSVFRGSWIADYPDAENYLSLFYSKNFAPNGPNYFHYKNSQFDAWYEQSLATVDVNLRNKLYFKMDSLLMSSAPIVPLYYDEVVRFSQKNVRGLGINPINLLNLKHVYKVN
jgi:peptide/nickel transport system substrate-binding protein